MWMKLYLWLIFKPHNYNNYAAVVFSFEFHEALNSVLGCVNYEFQRKESGLLLTGRSRKLLQASLRERVI
jgi:hypothetical protein